MACPREATAAAARLRYVGGNADHGASRVVAGNRPPFRAGVPQFVTRAATVRAVELGRGVEIPGGRGMAFAPVRLGLV